MQVDYIGTVYRIVSRDIINLGVGAPAYKGKLEIRNIWPRSCRGNGLGNIRNA